MDDTENRENMATVHAQSEFDLIRIVSEFSRSRLPWYPLILVFCTGKKYPSDCIPMKRIPEPATGHYFNGDFLRHLATAFAENESIHDGAVVLARESSSTHYAQSAWSVRIAAPHVVENAAPNRGAAYNSSLALSVAPDVDLVCLLVRDRTDFFSNGEIQFLTEGRGA
ncbi:hypothetical protein [Rhizobium leguminosarum]|uniref:hypothetical protein n=1 Tax=Rhizobium leguminosarum TaxID=384 RepID=UPI001C98D261|nr:hypothetical protein [Rhizobium leguminosarum]MBY5658492.1 hypothetical protein [Rhizobium leguminosarum]